MLDFLGPRASPRKLRLFAVACCRRLAPLLDGDALGVLEAAGRLADGLADQAEMCRVRAQARYAERRLTRLSAGTPGPALRLSALSAVRAVVHDDAGYAVRSAAGAVRRASGRHCLEKPPPEVPALVREVFGNPFRRVSWSPNGLYPDVSALARAAYEEHALPGGALDPVRLVVLADALEEAGCAEAALLAHLRGPGVHVRGCWAVDLIFGWK